MSENKVLTSSDYASPSDVVDIKKSDLEKDRVDAIPKRMEPVVTEDILRERLKCLQKKKISDEDLNKFKKVFENPEIANKVPDQLMKDLELASKDELSDEDIENMISDFNSFMSSTDKKEAEIIEGMKKENRVEKLDSSKLEERIVDVKSDPKTGQLEVVSDSTEYEDIELTDITEEKLKEINLNSKVNEMFGDANGFTDKDCEVLLDIIVRYKKGEEFSIYNALPESFKQLSRCMSDKPSLSGYHRGAKYLLDMVINNLKIDQAYIDYERAIQSVFSNLNEKVDEAFGDNFVNLYCEELCDRMEKGLMDLSEQVKESDPDKSKTMSEVSKAFTDSYSMNRQLEFIENNTSLRRILKKGLKDFKRIVLSVDDKYRESKLGIKSVKYAILVLGRKADSKYTDEDIKKFFILYHQLTMNYKAEDLPNYTFMYYTIQNIINLDLGQLDNRFNENLLNNIYKVIDKLKEVNI